MRSRRWWMRWPTVLLVGVAALVSIRLSAADRSTEAKHRASEARLTKDIFYLASEELEGRGVTTEGIKLAATHIAEVFEKAGLKPAPGAEGYFQPFDLGSKAAELDNPNTLQLCGPNGKDAKLELDEQFQVIGLSASGKVKAPIVFAGFGLTLGKQGYDDYKSIDVAGKVVIILRRTPHYENPDDLFKNGADPQKFAALEAKIANAQLHKAAAVILVNDRTTAKEEDELMTFEYTAQSRKPAKVPAVHATRKAVDALLQASLKTSLDKLEDKIDRTLQPCSQALEGCTANLEVTVQREGTPVKNVIGVLEGAGPLADETIVIGAHYDHLGYGGAQSLAGGDSSIHPGADDNGSGTTVMLELVRRLSAIPNRQGRRIVFMAFTAEESGLIGSAYYCENPLFPLENTVTMINLDMVGRLPIDEEQGKASIAIRGVGTSEHFGDLLDTLNKKHNFQMEKIASTKISGGDSDHSSFYARKIPVLFFCTGTHPDYHRPSDTADKINVVGMRMIADFVEDLAENIRTSSDKPEYADISSAPTEDSSEKAAPPRLGIKPSKDSQEGVLIGDVEEDGPAYAAGLRKGDRIVAIDGKPVKNLETYRVLIRNFRKDETVKIEIIRDGKKKTVEVELE